MVRCLWIDAGVDAARGEQRGQSRCKAQARGRVSVIERLDAQPVAREHHAAAVALPDGKGKHAHEPLDAAGTPNGISFQDDLSIAGRKELAAFALEFRAQLAKIVDTAVKDDS